MELELSREYYALTKNISYNKLVDSSRESFNGLTRLDYFKEFGTENIDEIININGRHNQKCYRFYAVRDKRVV